MMALAAVLVLSVLVWDLQDIWPTGGIKVSETPVVVTEGLTGSEPLVVFFVGDTGSGDDNQRRVAARMESECLQRQPQAIVLLGDNFYNVGVSGTDDPQWQDKFESMYSAPCLAARPFYAVLGNHDVRANPSAQIAYTGQGSGRWRMPSRTYGLAFGDRLKLALIDSNFPDYCRLPICSLDRLIEALKPLKTRWTLLVGHHPLVSGGKYAKPAWLPGRQIKASYCALGAQAYLSGHDHNLQSLVTKTSASEPCEVHQIVSGAGGASLYPATYLPELTTFAASEFGFVSGQFTNDAARFDFISTQQQDPLYRKML